MAKVEEGMTTKPQSTTEPELKRVIEDVIRKHHVSRTHPPTYCCPEDESVYERLLVRMLVEKLTAPASAAPVVDVSRKAAAKILRWLDEAGFLDKQWIMTSAKRDHPEADRNEGNLFLERALSEARDDITNYIAATFERYFSIAAAATTAPESKSCGFCGKSDQEVKALIQAPVGYICDECVAICASIIERAAPVEQQTPQTKLIDAVIYAVKEGCFFPVPEPKPGASVQELAQWGAMRNLHDAIAVFTREWKLREGAR